ncbi:unnamed protein product [Caenorhabditis nigoni]
MKDGAGNEAKKKIRRKSHEKTNIRRARNRSERTKKGVQIHQDFNRSNFLIQKSTPEKVVKEERQGLKKTIEQYRRNEIDTACSHLEEFLIMNHLNKPFESKLTRLQTLQLVKDHLKTIPDNTSWDKNDNTHAISKTT